MSVVAATLGHMSEEQPEPSEGGEAGDPDPASLAVPVYRAPGDEQTAATSPWPTYPWSAMQDYLARQRAIADAATQATEQTRRAGEQSAAAIAGLATLGAMALKAVRTRIAAAARPTSWYADHAAWV